MLRTLLFYIQNTITVIIFYHFYYNRSIFKRLCDGRYNSILILEWLALGYILCTALYYIIKYKLLQKLYKNTPILFCLCCVLILLFPVITISDETVSERENRMLNKFPHLLKNEKINQKFGIEFNEFINDHIGYRQVLIDWRAKLMYFLNGKIANDEVFIGDDGWMFPTHGTKYVDSIDKQKEKISKAVDILERFKASFKNKSVPIYVVLEPNREQIYQKYWEKYYPPQKQLDIGEYIQKAFENDKQIHVIYPKDIFMRQTKNVFYKNDRHLNGYGATIILKETLKEMHIDVPKYKITYNKQHVDSNEYSYSLGLPKENDVDKQLNIIIPAVNQADIHENLYKPMSETYPLIADSYSLNHILKRDIYIMGVCYTSNIIYPLFYQLSKKVSRTTFWPLSEQEETIDFRKDRIRKSFDATKDSIVILVLSLGIGREWDFIDDAMKGI